MKYLKNIEIAEQYKISPNTVGNWIESAEKNGLHLVTENHRKYIINNSSNHMVLKDLSRKGKKYKNTKSLRIVEPTEEFYETFDEKQIIDIISSLEVYKEVDMKYTYFNKGGKIWDEYIQRVMTDPHPYTVKSTIQLLKNNAYYLYDLINKYKYVNIVDIGAGNAYPVKELLKFFIKKGILKRYIAIDYSPILLDIAQNNVKNWYGDKIEVEAHNLDINYDMFKDILFKNSYRETAESDTVNIILFLGSTIENQRLYFQSLDRIKNSMGQNDIFVLGHRLDSETSRREIHFNAPDPSIPNSDISQYMMVLKLLNIPEDAYEVERFYSEKQKSRLFQAKLKTDIQINFKTKNFNKTLILSNKDKMIFFRHGHHTFSSVVNTLDNIGFTVLHATTALIYEQVVVISKIESL